MNRINGKKIAMIRKRRRLSQDQLAEKMNVSRASINNWEKNKTEIERVNLDELCKALNCKQKDLQDRINTYDKDEYYDRFCSIETIEEAYEFVDLELEDFEVDFSHEITTKFLLRKYFTWCLLFSLEYKERYNKELAEYGYDDRWDIENYIGDMAGCRRPIRFVIDRMEAIECRIFENEEVTDIERAMYKLRIKEEYYDAIERMNIAEEMIIYIDLFISQLREKSYINYKEYYKIVSNANGV